jgi:6,7-dimethyl-8-ribityllumazine synthase
MLQTIQSKKIQSRGGTFAIVASRYNARYLDAMLRAGGTVQIVRVPGAYEIPVAAARLARASRLKPRFPPSSASASFCAARRRTRSISGKP